MFITIVDIAVVTQIFYFTFAFTQQDTLSGTPTPATFIVIYCSTIPIDTGCGSDGGYSNFTKRGFADSIWFFGTGADASNCNQNWENA